MANVNTSSPSPGSRAEQRERTRAHILQVVLDIIVKDGMRAVRHRHVAEQAEVALGTTTYHFSSIEDLIVSAFRYWQSNSQLIENPYYKKMSDLFVQYSDVVPKTDRCNLVEAVYRISVEYICDQLSGKRDNRIVELAFYHESLQSEPLRELVLANWLADVEYLTSVHHMLGSPCPEEDARTTFSLFRQLEQAAIIANLPKLDTSVIKRTLHRHWCVCCGVDFSV